MPELPEVETVRRILQSQLQGSQICNIEICYEKVVDNVSPDQFIQILAGQSFRDFQRKGKYLIFAMDEGVLCCHLRMEGKFFVYEPNEKMDRKHIHLIFHLADGRMVCYHDTRKFGRFYWYQSGEPLQCISNLGYEPWDEELTKEVVYAMTRKARTATLKDFLLDQKYIAGVGNIYTCEICFAMKKHPATKVSTLSRASCQDLLDATRIILQRAVDLGGTTIRSYTASLGVTGRFQLSIAVYGKEGQPCGVCGTLIEKTMLHGRGTYFCPSCQRKRR